MLCSISADAAILDSSPAPTTTSPTRSAGVGVPEATAAGVGAASIPRPSYNSDCPALNNTVYHVPGSTKRFLRLCGIDYSGSGATDLAHVYTGSMADCIHACASFDQCTSCAWGYLEGDAGSEHRCYMKKELKTAHEVAGDWCLAVLQ